MLRFSPPHLKRLLPTVIVVGLFVSQSVLSYSLGQISQKNDNLAAATQSAHLLKLSGQYSTLYGLCEQKYQAGINGHLDTAYQIKGQMNQILQEMQPAFSSQQAQLR